MITAAQSTAPKGFSCTRACVRDGPEYVIVIPGKTGNKIYKLAGDKELFKELAGSDVTLTGRFAGENTFQVTGAAAAQK